MESTITIQSTDKGSIYIELFPQIKALVEGEPDLIANLANITAALKLALANVSWVGFYLLKEGELVLGPFQGKPACVRIAVGRGVCGAAAEKKLTHIVPDVHAFPGHIVCDPDARSEIVVPILHEGALLGVLDLDSNLYSNFDEVDKMHLEKLCNWLTETFSYRWSLGSG